jgi:hypothetical protein
MNPVLGGKARSRREDGIYGDGKDSVFKIMFTENRLLFSERFHRSWIGFCEKGTRQIP